MGFNCGKVAIDNIRRAFQLAFQIRNVKQEEPSDWEITGPVILYGYSVAGG